jgi:3-methyladenine DNA glycosylase/8-oxoguanine DNA glycosylase
MEITIRTPADFSFKRTVLSHGWCQLLPFEFDQDRWELRRVLEWPEQGGRACTIRIKGTKRAVRVSTDAQRLTASAKAKIERDVRHMLRLDEELKDFYGAVLDDPEFSWIAREGAGRLLRSPTVFEDLVKSLCTTNCSWALTEKMLTGLVMNLGREAGSGRKTFPTPEAMAHQPEKFYREVVRAGYRAPYLKELAERVAAKELNPESWLVSELPTPELKREMKRVKGVGDYAAENLLKLVGRYDCLALDSWVRAKFARTRGTGQGRRATVDDARIARFYSRFADWRGLALWCDMTRDWLD